MNEGVDQQSFQKGWFASFYEMLGKQNFREAATLLRFSNFVNAVLIVVTGTLNVLGTLEDILKLQLSGAIIPFYILFFGALLCGFECRVGFMEESLQKYFGFMYSFLGRTIFLLFLGLYCLALETGGVLNSIVAIVTFCNALLNCFVVYRHGNMFADPTKKYSSADEFAKQYAAENPELTRQAMEKGFSFAKKNPGFVGGFK